MGLFIFLTWQPCDKKIMTELSDIRDKVLSSKSVDWIICLIILEFTWRGMHNVFSILARCWTWTRLRRNKNILTQYFKIQSTLIIRGRSVPSQYPANIVALHCCKSVFLNNYQTWRTTVVNDHFSKKFKTFYWKIENKRGNIHE